jgi:pilus assembly protein CpaB
VLTQKQTNAGNQADFISKTILSNVRVLAVDQTIGDKDGQKVMVGKTATIQVDPQQAEKLANARQQGTISLALRSILDSQTTSPEQRRWPHFVVVYRGKSRELYSCIPECVQGVAETTTSDGVQEEATSGLTSRQ